MSWNGDKTCTTARKIGRHLLVYQYTHILNSFFGYWKLIYQMFSFK